MQDATSDALNSRRVWSGVSAFHDDLGQMVLMAQAASSGVDCLCLVDEFVSKEIQPSMCVNALFLALIASICRAKEHCRMMGRRY